MPRTLNVELHRVRRDAFLDVAERLIQTRGYEQMSIQDVLDDLEASRGAFYHYFDSKDALLDAVVERFADGAMAAVQPILDDPTLPALRKLELVIGRIAALKAQSKELMLALIEVWHSDANALVREKLRRLSADRLEPILSVVIRQGVGEGTFTITDPDETARIVLHLVQGFQDIATQQFLARQAGTITFNDVLRSQRAQVEAVERVLGAEPGSVRLLDKEALRVWFG